MHNLAIFASGGGSNAEKIIQFFEQRNSAKVAAVFSNIEEAGVLEKIQAYEVDGFVHPKDIWEKDNYRMLIGMLKDYEIDFIVLAGYLKKLAPNFVKQFPKRIVNIHPSLLPKYGGKGMYGMNVHQAVKKAGERETGMTIHYVNENYDEGAIIEQHKCDVYPEDSAEDIAARVLKLEHKYYAPCIERLVNGI